MRYLIPFLTIQAIALIILWLVFRKQIARKGDIKLKFLLITFGLYMTVLLFLLLNPVNFYHRLQFSTERLNLIPFRFITEWKSNPVAFSAGILLFLPLGYFNVLFHPEKSAVRKILNCVLVSGLLSLMIEIAQMWTGRTSDIDDVILNIFGCFVGAGMCLLELKSPFAHTKIGSFLLWEPSEIPETSVIQKGQMRIQLYCNILAVSAFCGILLLNYVVTQPDYKTYTFNEETLELEGRNIALQSMDTGDILFEVNADQLISPASTMKTLAALTALDYMDADDTIRLGSEVYAAPIDCSRAGLESGMELSVRELLEGALLPSGADAIYALGTKCGRLIADDPNLSTVKAMKLFAEAMNAKAAALGADHTHVVSPDGYDADGQYTTARDLLLIGTEFIKNPVLAEICDLAEDRISLDDGQTLNLCNTNAMLHEDNIYYNSGVSGIKTGTTDKAGNCLVSIFTINKKQYLCVVMGSTYDGKFRDTQTLFDYCEDIG